ncbi:hypothetical protein [Pseudomonas kermanshahensis]|uniref:hypothetical protein n=1 Tax=Pseudomonas kermanshahensis TaxID=2745482 RepID=UPI002092F131|nr:hypothetical protein [Pseudomonas kermanshahensis]USS54161.1 hypothetical protein NG836_20435 [Pseudomonas kermanshahensis]
MKLPVTVDYDAVAADIPTMQEMPIDGYASYIANDLFFVDHHGVLRAALGEYPIATSAEQLDELIRYLNGVSTRMRGA